MKIENGFNFKTFERRRKKFLKANKKKSFVILGGEGKVMFSVPHAVKQVRLGKVKFAEPNTLALALEIREKTNIPMIVKTACFNDDANFDLICPYREELRKYIEGNGIKYLVDLHSLNANREQDIDLGVNFGLNIAPDEKMFDFLEKEFAKRGFKVVIDQPFNGGARTISSFISRQCGIWTLQLEINTRYLYFADKVERLQEIISVLFRLIEKINNDKSKNEQIEGDTKK